ncbi:MAG: CBS domain-containing protein [Syntrophomonadaceae bacterium]|jgi:CBS domain-containing protein
MLAKDIMTRDVITVSPDDRVEDVARLLVTHRISGIPVIDQDKRILGIITEKDLVIKASELKVPFFITLFDSIIFLENPIRFSNNLKKYTAYKVREAMTEKVATVEEDATLDEVIKIMQKKRINRVPVLRHGKLVGIISRNDILKALVKTNG